MNAPCRLSKENGEAVLVPGIGQHAHFPFTAWEYDGEGFGNPGIHDHPHAYYAPSTR